MENGGKEKIDDDDEGRLVSVYKERCVCDLD